MKSAGLARTQVIEIDGGMVANDWFCQRLADLPGFPSNGRADRKQPRWAPLISPEWALTFSRTKKISLYGGRWIAASHLR
jgi:hypothetical protein